MKYAPVPARHDRDVRVENLQDILPSLVLRLDHRAVRIVETLLGNAQREITRDDTPRGVDDAMWQLWQGLIDVIGHQSRALELLQQDWRTFTQRHALLSDEQARQQIILDYIQTHTRGVFARLLDRRAVRNTLDLDALQERQTLAESAHIAAVRVACLGLEQLGYIMLERTPPAQRLALVRTTMLRAPGLDVLREWIERGDDAELAWLNLRALQPALEYSFAHTTEHVAAGWLRILASWLADSRASSWMQITTLEILSASPDSGASLLEEHVRAIKARRDNWHTRAHAITLLIERFPESSLGVVQAVLEEEPHDGVVMAALNALDPEELVGLEDLAALMETIEELLLSHEHHAAPTRAAAASAAGRFAHHRTPLPAAALVEHLGAEPDPDVLGLSAAKLCDALLTRREDTDLTPLVEGVIDRLNRRIALEPMAHLAHQLVHARQQLRAIVEPEDQIRQLVRRLEALDHGKSLQLTEDLSLAQLARAMQLATPGRYGLYARRGRAGSWRIERGEQLRFKWWRVLHEVRSPSPNKRQDISHARGKHYPGWLRAHSDALGEVTPTAVPGERRMIREEGGWGAYLPLVDDLLDAQRQDTITLVSEEGLTHITAPRSRARKIKNYAYLSWNYERFDLKRSQALRGRDAAERGKYLEDIETLLGVSIAFEPHTEQDTIAAPLLGLFSETVQGRRLLETHQPERALLTNEPRPLMAVPLIAAVGDWLLAPIREVGTQLGDRLFSRGQVRGQELLIVMFAALLSFVLRMVWVRGQVDRWRKRIPLSVGGWGTRGKSGTERLKAGMFQGLGYDVFVKTTGCEAMFIHAPRRGSAREIFIYRPYDKASIWEQRDMLGLGAAMQSDVFLWECMALNPRYVEILQSIWMRDDLVTLTNAYPDHEDIQGPTGADVARTIARFIPKNRTVITAEREMLPVLRERARAQQSTLITVVASDELALSNDLLDRFPYREHPRNIALVKRLAIELGIDPEFAVFAMADEVVPDLGVLKVYPGVNLLGRRLTFINGCSANERAGFMNNWYRMALHELDPRQTPERVVVTVVNNRADRIARSRVFADILVSDIAFDHHILIGTNLSGLRTYMEEALDDLLQDLVIVEPSAPDESEDEATARSTRRLRTLIERVRLIDHDQAWVKARLQTMTRACGAQEKQEITLNIKEIITPPKQPIDSSDTLDKMAETIAERAEFKAWLESVSGAIPPVDEALPEGHPERIARASIDALRTHAAELLATTRAAHLLHDELVKALRDGTHTRRFHELVVRLFRERFWRMVVTIQDAQSSGDAIIAHIARSVAPGSDIQIMGTQNIKGTGLDFVYRWVELGETMRQLEGVHPSRKEAFQDAMVALGTTEAMRLTEALNVRAYLLDYLEEMTLGAREQSLIQRAVEHLEELAARRWQAAQPSQASATGDTWRGRLLREVETWLDPIDAIWRRRRAEYLQRLFVARRISHKRMASEMQKLNKRQKGGWLGQ